MITSRVKIPKAVANAVNFIAGTIGSAAEQGIGRGRVSIGRSILDGIDNMIGNSRYGTGRLENLKNATVRGMKAGAANAGLGYFADLVDPAHRLDVSGAAGLMAGMAGSLLMRDPGRCGSPSPFHAVLGYSMAKGYRYGVSQTGFGKRKKSSLMGFVGETLRGAVTGGVTSAAFYGAGKGIEKLWNGFLAGRERKLGLFLPDKHYQKHLPSQVSSKIKYLPKYDETGNVKQIKIYDDYGRESGWVDYTNHGYGDINSSDYHTIPHWHEKYIMRNIEVE